jgi:hypothetical protein
VTLNTLKLIHQILVPPQQKTWRAKRITSLEELSDKATDAIADKMTYLVNQQKKSPKPSSTPFPEPAKVDMKNIDTVDDRGSH